MNVYVINFYAETFNSGDEGTRYTYYQGFKSLDQAVEYVKTQFIPRTIKETQEFYPDEEVEVRFLYEDKDSWTLGTFIDNEQLEVMTIDIQEIVVLD